MVLSEQFRDLEQTHMKIGISSAAVPEYENAFNRTFIAILTLEIAKKGPVSRGRPKMKFNLDINKVASDMLQASASSLVKGGEQASEYASHEYAQFIEDIEHVQTMAERRNN